MQKSSWTMLGVAAALMAFLLFAYITSHNEPPPLTAAQANAMLKTMQDAAERKDVNTIMGYVAPDAETRIADLSPNQLRTFLSRAFYGAGSVKTNTSNITFAGGKDEAVLGFDMRVGNNVQDMSSDDWHGHVMLHLRPVAIPKFLGLYHAKEWRITSGTTNGTSPASFVE